MAIWDLSAWYSHIIKNLRINKTFQYISNETEDFFLFYK